MLTQRAILRTRLMSRTSVADWSSGISVMLHRGSNCPAIADNRWPHISMWYRQLMPTSCHFQDCRSITVFNSKQCYSKYSDLFLYLWRGQFQQLIRYYSTNVSLHHWTSFIYSVSRKNPPLWFSDIFFSNDWEFLLSFFTHLLYVSIHARLQIFIQLSPILTKLCHTKRDHPSNFFTFQ